MLLIPHDMSVVDASVESMSPVPVPNPAAGLLETSLRRMFETTPIPMWIVDVTTLRFLEVNDAAVRQYGYSRQEFLSMTFFEIRPHDERVRLIRHIRTDPRPTAFSAGIWRHQRKDGSILFVEIVTHSLIDDHGHRELVFALDVTERVRAEKEMAERNGLAQLVAESADALAGADTLRGGLQICAELLNRHIDAFLVRVWTLKDSQTLETQALAGKYTEFYDQYFQVAVSDPLVGQIARDGLPYVTNEFGNSPRVPYSEPGVRAGLTSFAGYPLAIKGRILGVIAAFARHPLTDAAIQAFASVAHTLAQFIERKSAEESVRNLAALVENSSDAVVMATPDGRVTYINDGGCRLMGFGSAKEAIGLEIRELHSESGWQRVLDELIPEATQSSHWQGENQLRHYTTGEPIDVLLTAFLVRDQDGQVVARAAIMHDIRERKHNEENWRRAKETAESASRLKSEFLANMSHEIRTPMNGIIAMTDLTLETELTEEQRDYLDTVKQSAETLLKIINDILDFSKIEAGKLALDCIQFNLQETIEETLNLMTPTAHQKGLRLQSAIAPGVPKVLQGDPVRLRQILFNLVGNAIKFTASGGVTVRVREEAIDCNRVCLHFEVQDTGIGIPEDKQQVIFEAFAQADGSMSRRFGGTGLGLTICSRLVQMMNGRIWVVSVPEKGSSFHFTACFAQL